MSGVEDARLYLVTPARIAAGDLAPMVGDLAAAGVDIVQLREKDMEAGDLVRAGAPILEACRAAGIQFIVNDRPDVALALEADGVHLGQNDLSVGVARRILGGACVGVSTHSPEQVDAVLASDEPVDYMAAGPVYETPTKPGRAPAGLDLVRYAADTVALAWFAIGGINARTLDEVMAAGARRIVVVRAITEALDPIAAAAELRAGLDSMPPPE